MANAIIRQEINILDAILSAAGGSSATSNEKVQFDTTQYNGTATYYFEVVADSSISLAFTVTLNGATDGTLATCTIPLGTTAYTRIRSTSFTPTTLRQDCTVVISNTAGATKNVKSARIIIIQSASTLTNTETQIEIGNNETTIATVSTALINAKYWLYTSANWNGATTFYTDVTYACSSTKSAMTITLQEDNGSFASWVDKVTLVSAGTATTPTRVRSIAFTPTNGRNYRIAGLVGSSKSLGNFYNAKIIIDQNEGGVIGNGATDSAIGVNGGIAASGESQQQLAQSFKVISNATLTSVDLWLFKNNTPVDNFIVDITSSAGGTSLGTASIAASSLTGGAVRTTFTLNTPVSLTANTTYYIQMSRSGARDITNVVEVLFKANSIYSAGGDLTRDNTVWSSVNVVTSLCFSLTGIVGFTNSELQYMFLNTADSGSTGLQIYNSLWDSTEWNDTQGGLPTFKYSQDATNAADASKLVDITASADVTGATVTGANQQISAAFTMPTTGHQVDGNVTNTTGVVGAIRVLAIYTVNSVVIPPNVPYTNPNLQELLLMGVGI